MATIRERRERTLRFDIKKGTDTGTTWTPGPEEAWEFTVDIDVDGILDRYARQAARNRSLRSKIVDGAVTVWARKKT